VVLPNDQRGASADNGVRIAVDQGRGGPMTARIFFQPAADRQQATGAARSSGALPGVY
jgi:hypothetical protein